MPDDILPAENFVRPFVIWDCFSPFRPIPGGRTVRKRFLLAAVLPEAAQTTMPPADWQGA